MKVAVGLSGGVDSSVAAGLLKKAGHEVMGITMKIWDGKIDAVGGGHACYGPDEADDLENARQVAEKLDIPYHVFDLSAEYRKVVLEYFESEYVSGRTPNPCLRCNPVMKFGLLPEKALSSGLEFDYFATGHYARVSFDNEKNKYILRKARDTNKDQSYGLIFLSQEQMGRMLLPLGELTKTEVRAAAREMYLKTHDIPDSQDFYTGDHTDLINARPRKGQIMDTLGNELGKHDGIWHYTVGQRKGLGLMSEKPMYVKEIDANNNKIIVGTRSQIFSSGLIASNLNFITIESLTEPMEVGVKIRHTPMEYMAKISPMSHEKVQVEFKEPQWAVTPGQAIAFYQDDIVLGGGIIDTSFVNEKLRPNEAQLWKIDANVTDLAIR